MKSQEELDESPNLNFFDFLLESENELPSII